MSISIPTDSNRKSSNPVVQVRVARGFDDVLMAFAIRAAVYMAEQACPYAEEFDGNDSCAMHIVGFVDGEPAATLRLRFFGDFAKMERVAVRKEFRGSKVTMAMITHAFELLRKKGVLTLYGHSMAGLETFWSRAGRRYGGFRPIPGAPPVYFSGHRFTQICIHLPPLEEALHIDSSPEEINRPEGEWDTPGVLETPHMLHIPAVSHSPAMHH